MPSPDNLNLNRNYKVNFFDIVGEDNFTVSPLTDFIQNSANFSFDYTITNQTLNTSKFNFYNLSKKSIDLFASPNNRRGFSIDIWYGQPNNRQFYTLFKGITFTTNTFRVGPDIVTEVVGCDLFLNLLFKGIEQSFVKNSTYLFIVNTIIKYYGSLMSLSSDSVQYLQTKTYKTPKIFKGNILDIFQTIANDAGLFFNLHNNILYFFTNKSSFDKNSVVSHVITPTNGLVGSVRAEALSIQLFPVSFFDNSALDKNVSILTVNTLLRPYILYETVQLKSQQFSGFYGILSLTQRGEWRENPWYSTLKLMPAVNK